MLVVPMLGHGLAAALLLLKPDLPVLVGVLILTGLLSGPLDIALFTVRQRRTDRRWTGRAFAVSMSFNALGIPIGSFIAGMIADASIETAIALSAVTSVLAGVLAAVMIPATEQSSGNLLP